MYKKSRTITECVSNNRLNWDERVNRTIVVPNLINGSLDDVQISTDTAIECDVDGRLVAGKGLKHFVFLEQARVPTWIMDNHNHAFAFWHQALYDGCIAPGSLLVHIDQHTDLGTPSEMPRSRQNTKDKVQNNGITFENLEEVEHYTNSVLTIADFIVPALATGLISEAVMITGEKRDGVGVFIWEIQKTKYRGHDEGSLIKKSPQLTAKNQKLTTIVDLDLDYFSQGFDDEKTLETVRYWLARADIITIATSPLFIDQQKALTLLKGLQNSLLAL